MAGNFWKSSHYQQWMMDRQDLLRERQADLKVLTEEEYQKLMIFFSNFIQTLGEQTKVRQQVIATAMIYFKRFYARNSLKSIDPLLMAPTCIFLASKVEEFGVISNNRLLTTCQQVVKNRYGHAFTSQEFPYKMNHVLECEFYLLEMMDCCLIVYHPFRSLPQFIKDIASGSGTDEAFLKTAWRTINDSLRTDVSLLFPPYIISLAAIMVSAIHHHKDLKHWFAELSVDIEKVGACVREINKYVDFMKKYQEHEEIHALLGKMPRPNPIPSRPPSQGTNSQDMAGGQGQQQPTQSHS